MQETLLGAEPLVAAGAASLPALGEDSGLPVTAALALHRVVSHCGRRRFGGKKGILSWSWASVSTWLVWASCEDADFTRG